MSSEAGSNRIDGAMIASQELSIYDGDFTNLSSRLGELFSLIESEYDQEKKNQYQLEVRKLIKRYIELVIEELEDIDPDDVAEFKEAVLEDCGVLRIELVRAGMVLDLVVLDTLKPFIAADFSKKPIAVETPSRPPDLTSAHGDVWLIRSQKLGVLGGGSTSTVLPAIFRSAETGVAVKAVAKIMFPHSNDRKKSIILSQPEGLLAEAAILRLGIAGLPTYYTSGFRNGDRLVDVLPYPNSYPNISTPHVLVMEMLPTDTAGDLKTDQFNCFRSYNDKSDDEDQEKYGSPLHQEAVIIALLYYYLYVVAQLHQHGWSRPYDFYVGSNTNMVFSNKEGNFHACDFGMSDPLTSENTLTLVDQLGGSGIFDIMRKKEIDTNIINTTGAAGKVEYKLELGAQKESKLGEVLEWLKKQDSRGDFLHQMTRVLGKYVSSQTDLETKLRAIGVSNKPINQRLQKFMREVCADQTSSQNWIGLEIAFRRRLLETDVFSPELKKEVQRLLSNTGITI